jgi:hypothetical protein
MIVGVMKEKVKVNKGSHWVCKCVFICNWIKKRREPRTNNVTIKL